LKKNHFDILKVGRTGEFEYYSVALFHIKNNLENSDAYFADFIVFGKLKTVEVTMLSEQIIIKQMIQSDF
jgi:hypothetical protein